VFFLSPSTLCNFGEDSPLADTILYHLWTKFESERLDRVANTLLRRDVAGLFAEQVGSVHTTTCGPTTVARMR
jgi:hypothetical protein